MDAGLEVRHGGEPCVICVAIPGSLPTRANSPAVPITVAEAEVRAAAEATLV